MRFCDIRVLDFCWVGAGAFVTRLLADMGADVIKVESHAHPDNLRLSGPHKGGAKHLEGSGYFASRNTNKKSLALNMGHPEARALAKRLARECSIVTNNFRPGIMERWGLGYQELMFPIRATRWSGSLPRSSTAPAPAKANTSSSPSSNRPST